MQIANSLASTGGTLHKVYNYWKLLSPSKRRLTASFQSQNVDRLNFFSPFLSHLYNVKKLDSKPKCVDETSRISGCFSRNCFHENYFFLGNIVHAVSMTTSPQDIYPREKSKGLWQQYDDDYNEALGNWKIDRAGVSFLSLTKFQPCIHEKMYKPIPWVAS